jgi:pimeloyl-ACP methyl ester carboxylesterase
MQTLSHGERLRRINGVELCVETFGDPAHPPILLVDGAAASMLWWEEDLCALLAAAGRYVIRYDNRDTGRSTWWPPGRPGYGFADLAADAVGILDDLGIARVHLVCRSMSGGVGLIAGVDHPDRVATLTFVSSSTGADGLPPPSAAVTSYAPPDPDPADPAAVAGFVAGWAVVEAGGSSYADEAAIRALAERDVARARNIASTLVNHYALTLDGPAGGGFGDIVAPTLVVHGDRDPLLPLPHGEALRDAIPGAELVVLPGAGHHLPRPLWPEFVAALARHTGRARP